MPRIPEHEKALLELLQSKPREFLEAHPMFMDMGSGSMATGANIVAGSVARFGLIADDQSANCKVTVGFYRDGVAFTGYWCPYVEDVATVLVVGADADFMFTANMSGCTFLIARSEATVTVSHSNAGQFGTAVARCLGDLPQQDEIAQMQQSFGEMVAANLLLPSEADDEEMLYRVGRVFSGALEHLSRQADAGGRALLARLKDSLGVVFLENILNTAGARILEIRRQGKGASQDRRVVLRAEIARIIADKSRAMQRGQQYAMGRAVIAKQLGGEAAFGGREVEVINTVGSFMNTVVGVRDKGTGAWTFFRQELQDQGGGNYRVASLV